MAGIKTEGSSVPVVGWGAPYKDHAAKQSRRDRLLSKYFNEPEVGTEEMGKDGKPKPRRSREWIDLDEIFDFR